MILKIFVVLAKLAFGYLACIAFYEARQREARGYDGGIIGFGIAGVCTFLAVIMSFIPMFG